MLSLAEKLRQEAPSVMEKSEAGDVTFQLNEKGESNSLQIVLLHEMERFNKLLSTVQSSLNELGKAIKGLVVMSAELDGMYSAMLKNQVPQMWAKVAYPSLKPLSSWMKDLAERVAFMRSWIT